ncbi:MAG: hypothetical protein V9E81_12105 [Marmoricola sp.]|jgi:hypothetical protein
MTFDLFPGYIWVVAMIATALTVGALALVAAAVGFFTTHHRIRVGRHETMTHYYSHLALGH